MKRARSPTSPPRKRKRTKQNHTNEREGTFPSSDQRDSEPPEGSEAQNKKERAIPIKQLGPGMRLVSGFILLDTDELDVFLSCLPQTKLDALLQHSSVQGNTPEEKFQQLQVVLHRQYRLNQRRVPLVKELLALPDEEFENVNPCLLAAVENGFVELSTMEHFGNVLLEGKCYSCKTSIQCTIEQALFQPERGADYTTGGASAAVICTYCGLGNYISQLCLGRPSEFLVSENGCAFLGLTLSSTEFVSGAFHHHCPACVGSFGHCVSALCTSVHCQACHQHYTPTEADFGCACAYH